MCVQLQIAHSTLVHANDLEELVEYDVGDVDEHLIHQFGISGIFLMVVDCVPASAVMLLQRLIRVLCLGLS